MAKLTRIHDLFDEHHEVAAWLCLALSVTLLLLGKLDQWPFVCMVGLSLLTLLGASYYRGVRVGPNGISVGDDQ